MELETMPRATLERRLERFGQAISKACNALIEAGRGHEKPQGYFTQPIEQLDALAFAYVKASNEWRALNAERERRHTWHGSAHPIKRAA